LILLDIKLDHSNGLDVCKEIKNSYLGNMPVYIMSGLPDVDKKAYEAGADFFLPKPFDSETLLAKIKTLENSSFENHS
jgi:DNA-binding response OmpR family regulator